jgi:hypothetical protein
MLYVLCSYATGWKADRDTAGWNFSKVAVTGGKGNSCNYKPSGFAC